jgi:hypothetical protein
MPQWILCFDSQAPPGKNRLVCADWKVIFPMPGPPCKWRYSRSKAIVIVSCPEAVPQHGNINIAMILVIILEKVV